MAPSRQRNGKSKSSDDGVGKKLKKTLENQDRGFAVKLLALPLVPKGGLVAYRTVSLTLHVSISVRCGPRNVSGWLARIPPPGRPETKDGDAGLPSAVHHQTPTRVPLLSSQDPAEVCIELPWCVGQGRMQQGALKMQHIQEQEKLPRTIGPLCRCGRGLPSTERP